MITWAIRRNRVLQYWKPGSFVLLTLLSVVIIAIRIGLIAESLFSVEILFYSLVPGYAVAIIFFREVGRLEKLLLSLGLSTGLLIGMQLLIGMTKTITETAAGLIIALITAAILLSATFLSIRSAT